MLYLAAYTKGDIVQKEVLDLGCGTGRLALGALFLGAKRATGVDIDKTSIKIALKNAKKSGLSDKALWVCADLNVIQGKFDTVLQNPPFGIWKRGADRQFLRKALNLGKKIYSLHKSIHKEQALVESLKASRTTFKQTSPSLFLEDFVEQYGGSVEAVYTMIMSIPHMFRFHRKRKHDFAVDLYVINT
jgi:putative methylase